MPPRNPELPEGTDHIINGAMETSANGDTSGGSSSGGSGFVASGGAGGTSDDTGGTAMTNTGGTNTGGTGETASGGTAAPVKQQLRDGVQSLKGQAGDKARTYALQGKDRATSALDDFSNVIRDAASQIDERLGGDYGRYAHRAADTVSTYAENLRNKEVDDLFDDARNVIRKSPGIAIGAAALVGFTLVRLIKAGLEDNGNGASGGTGGKEVQFTPARGPGIDFEADDAASAGAGPTA